jgi:hypothetical protein
MTKPNNKLIALATTATTALSVGVAKAAAPPDVQEGANSAQGQLSGVPLGQQIANITNTLLLVIGVVAVIMLIVGGFRYIFSQGDESAVKGAKDTILFAIIGIVVALLSYAIVNFVIGRF